MRRGRTGGTAGRRRGEVGGVGPCAARAEGGLQKTEADAGKKEILGAFKRRRDAERGHRFSCFLGFYH